MNTPADRLPGADHEHTVPESEGLAADVPAGGAGADTGAVSAAEIDADDVAHVPNTSGQNDLPGVGTRGADAATPAPDERPADGEPHVDPDTAIGRLQPGVGKESAESSRIARHLPAPDAT